MDNQPMQDLNISSITGIVIASMFAVEIVKRVLGCFPTTNKFIVFLQNIPVFVYAILIAAGLALLANKVIKTGNGTPLLNGEPWKILWAAVVGAAGSSGFYSWLRPEGSKEAMETPSKMSLGSTKLPLILMMLALIGCTSCPEKAVLREGMDGVTRTIRQQHLDWADKLTIDPSTGKNHADQIPPLTPAQHNQIIATHKEYQDLVDEDRANDKKAGWFGSPTTQP